MLSLIRKRYDEQFGNGIENTGLPCEINGSEDHEFEDDDDEIVSIVMPYYGFDFIDLFNVVGDDLLALELSTLCYFMTETVNIIILLSEIGFFVHN